MKKVLALAAVGVFVLASCKKDYTCECTATNGSISTTSTSTVNGTKKDAKTACENGSATSGNASVVCKIK